MNKNELKIVIGRNIRKYRKSNKNNITQIKLAELIGVKRSLISAIESENTNTFISIFNLYKISQVLNVRIDKFFEVEL